MYHTEATDLHLDHPEKVKLPESLGMIRCCILCLLLNRKVNRYSSTIFRNDFTVFIKMLIIKNLSNPKSTMKSATNEPNALFVWWVNSIPDSSLCAYVETEEQVE